MQRSDAEAVLRLLDSGVSPNVGDEAGETPVPESDEEAEDGADEVDGLGPAGPADGEGETEDLEPADHTVPEQTKFYERGARPGDWADIDREAKRLRARDEACSK